MFALRHLPEEVVAVLFAYYSRSRDSLRQNLLKLLSEGDLALLGHQSVAGAAEPAAAHDDDVHRTIPCECCSPTSAGRPTPWRTTQTWHDA